MAGRAWPAGRYQDRKGLPQSIREQEPILHVLRQSLLCILCFQLIFRFQIIKNFGIIEFPNGDA